MDDLISRQAALDALGDMPMSWADTDAEIQAQEDWKQHREALLKLPTAEKKGKWIWKIGMVMCDQCLRAIRRIDCDGLLNYCPNCGAKMEASDGNSD